MTPELDFIIVAKNELDFSKKFVESLIKDLCGSSAEKGSQEVRLRRPAHLIFIDNASTDETPAIIKRYEHARTPVVAHRNERTLPMVANWNAAVSLVPIEAKYFRVLSADDLIAPDFIARTVAVAERHASIVAVGGGLSHRGEELGSAGWDPEEEVFLVGLLNEHLGDRIPERALTQTVEAEPRADPAHFERRSERSLRARPTRAGQPSGGADAPSLTAAASGNDFKAVDAAPAIQK